MAGSQSFKKRENEKKKQAKRLEKQKRKEERQAAGPSSMDEMIAWVDENGNLTSIPPEEREVKRVEIKLEDIDISTPRQEYVEVEPLKGLVDHFNAEKGYGFIRDLAGGEKYFFHISSAPQEIAEGNAVTFELERGQRGMNAVRIMIVK
ncbi:MAG: cold shock domain-containing protein [Bacteroidales bacterium]|nr:cold shock domain-containing protein [Bacteroidales bacterium]MDD3990403.1 cold shock domain-containing protein [Bacteroidales bacterium]